MKNIKVSFGFISFFVAFGSMVLANGLVLLFWHKDAIVREVRGVERHLEVIAGLCQTGNTLGPDTVKEELLSLGEQVHAKCIYMKQEQGVWLREDPVCKKNLESVIAEAVASKESVNRITPIQTPFGSSNIIFNVAISFADEISGASIVALAVSLHHIDQDLFAKERIIIVYLFVNALIIAVLLFFRLSKTILRPLDKLVQLADSYKGDGQYALLNSSPGNEFGQLSRSMHAMLERIDKDRLALKETIEQLEVANQELRAGRREMIQAEKLAVTGRLAAGLAHEIGNPLGIVGGYLELLKKKDVSSAEKFEFVNRAEGEVSRLHGLVKQLVDCSRPAVTGRERFHAQPIVEEVVDTLRYGKGDREFEFVVQCDAVDDQIEATVDGLRQVLLNCLLNAVDAIKEQNPHGGGRVTVLSANTKSGETDFWVLQIVDNGAGIPKEQRDCIFDPFFTTKAPGSGTGLGLTVSRSIMESLGGEIVCINNDSMGTTMELSFPLTN